MQLYIMRHGQAELEGQIDAQRKLTEQGELEVCVMAKWLQKQAIEFDHVLVSPYKRAQQTSQIICQQLDCIPKIETLNIITPMDDAKAVHDYLDGISNFERIKHLLVVSHMPLVSYLVEDLTIERNSPIFPTAAIAQIDYDLKRMKGTLSQLISPHDLC